MEQKEQEKTVGQLVEAWKTGDIDALTEVLGKGEKDNPELKRFYHNLLHTRNEKMVDKIAGYIDDERNCFVIIGAAHLIGDSGIVELLRRKGYEVNRS